LHFGAVLQTGHQYRLARLWPITPIDIPARLPVEYAAVHAADLGRDMSVDDRPDIQAWRLTDRQRTEHPVLHRLLLFDAWRGLDDRVEKP
jgi:hypothetical protein